MPRNLNEWNLYTITNYLSETFIQIIHQKSIFEEWRLSCYGMFSSGRRRSNNFIKYTVYLNWFKHINLCATSSSEKTFFSHFFFFGWKIIHPWIINMRKQEKIKCIFLLRKDLSMLDYPSIMNGKGILWSIKVPWLLTNLNRNMYTNSFHVEGKIPSKAYSKYLDFI